MQDIEILEYEGDGYDATMNFGSWRVALANYTDGFDREKCERLERHLETDEVFVLLCGQATLITELEKTETPMEIGKLYNVKLGAWHALFMEKGSKVLIVEEHSTCEENSEFHYFK
jgi:mannose-6-phosphate isomerase-like protein (cupin superfamily)